MSSEQQLQPPKGPSETLRADLLDGVPLDASTAQGSV